MLDRENSVLVIIDVQDKLVQATKYGADVTSNVCKLAAAAKLLEIPTIITEQYPQGLGQTVDILRAAANYAIYIEKNSFSAYRETEFAQKLDSINRKQVILCGIENHICVLQTAIDLLNKGYDVHIIKDACASRNKQEFKSGLKLQERYGAKISCLEIALFELLKSSKNPNFKEIQALIK